MKVKRLTWVQNEFLNRHYNCRASVFEYFISIANGKTWLVDIYCDRVRVHSKLVDGLEAAQQYAQDHFDSYILSFIEND